MAAGGLPAPDIYRLWARSRGRCAEPSCRVPLIERNGAQWTTVGEVAHIAAQSPGGPRYNAALTSAQIDSYDNTVLLCRRHHRIVDGNPQDYPPSVLRRWKAEAEVEAPSEASGGLSILRAPAQCLGFVPRRRLIDEITARLNGQRPAPVALCGLSGAGKSELARATVDELALDPGQVWWFDGGDGDVLRTQLGLAGERLGIERWSSDDARSFAGRTAALLASLDQVFVVIDNLASWLDLPPELIGRARLVITTQSSTSPPGVYRVEVGGLESEEVAELLGHLDEPDLVRLTELAHAVPIVLVQFRTILSASGMSTGRLIDLLEGDRAAVLENLTTDGDRSFAWSLGKVLGGLDPQAVAVLKLLGHLAPAAVHQSWLSEIGHAQGAFGLPTDEIGLENALMSLRERSLIARNDDQIVLHDLVRAFATRGEEALAHAWFSLCTVVVSSNLPEDDRTSGDREVMAALLPHLLYLVDTCPPQLLDETAPYLVNRAAAYYQSVGLDADAEVLLRRGLEVLDQPLAPMRATLLNNLANIAAARLDLDAALAMHLEAVHIKESSPATDPVIQAISYSALATTYDRLDQPSEARRWFEMALPLYEEAGDDRRFLDCLNDLGALDAAQGLWLSAFLYACEAVEREAGSNSDHLAKAHSLAAEVLLQHSFGLLNGLLLAAASEHANRAVLLAESNSLDIEEQRSAYGVRGRVRSRLGDKGGAVDDLERAAALLLESSTRSEFGIATSRGNLGRGLCAAGDVPRGLRLLRQSATDIEQLVGVGHPNWVVALTLLVENLVPAGLIDEAQTVMLRLREAGSTGSNVDAAERILANALQ